MKACLSTVFCTIVMCLLCTSIFAQEKTKSKVYLQQQMKMVSIDDHLKSRDFFTSRSATMGLSSSDEMVLKTETKGKNNYSYQKYEQIYKGVPVFGSAYSLRIKNGIVQRASGYYLPLIDIDVEPKISSERALRKAMHEMPAEEYSWENEAIKKMSSQADKPEPKLVIIDGAYPYSSEYYKLAYQVDLYSTKPMDKKRFFIDAVTGNVILNLPLLMHQSVPGSGECNYYGEQNFTVDSVGPSEFVLRDLTRGEGNTVFDATGELFTNTTSHWGLDSNGQAEVAVDAHYCTEKFYDFMLSTFGWDGVDNNGGSMNAVVHAGDFVNAFWDGEFASFGDGDCNHGALTTLEVVGHEFMHGITDYSSDLIYAEESGAINESMSDIFGKGVEFFADPDSFSWTIGGSFLETEFAFPFRSFEDPNAREHPAYYQGEYWSQDGAVHTNSSIGNHWFYLMVNGGMGINEGDDEYNVAAIGMEKALEIVFLTQTTALTPNSDYSFYLASSLVVAEEVYGEGSPEFLAVQEAWKAVGVDEVVIGLEDKLDLSVNVGNTFIETCIVDDNLTFNFSITNSGTEVYNPAMGGAIELSLFSSDDFAEDLIIPLEDVITPGETVSFTIEDYVFITNSTFLFIDIAVLLDSDDDTSNNDESIFVSNTIIQRDDLTISARTSGLPGASACFGGLTNIDFAVTNISCEAIAKETPFEIKVYNTGSEPIWSKSFTMPFDLATGINYVFSEAFDFSNLEDENVRFELDYQDDVENSNNVFNLTIPTIKVVDAEYEQDFSQNISQVGGDELEFSNIANYETSFPFPYQQENYFAVSSEVFSFGSTLCAEPADLFNTERLTIAMCVDTENIANPNVSFDLIQFRTEEDLDFVELSDNTNIVKVSWTDGENDFEELIIGQTEGDLINHQYPLPDNSKGIVTIEFFNNQNFSMFNDLFDDDITLLDNLAIGKLDTKVKNLQAVQFDIRPNPTDGLINISYPDTPEALILRNIHGQEILHISPDPLGHALDISHLPQGNYSISLIYEDSISTSLISKVNN